MPPIQLCCSGRQEGSREQWRPGKNTLLAAHLPAEITVGSDCDSRGWEMGCGKRRLSLSARLMNINVQIHVLAFHTVVCGWQQRHHVGTY